VNVRVVQLVDHSLEQGDEFVAVLHVAKVRGIQRWDGFPACRLRVEVGVARRNGPDRHLEVLLEIVWCLRDQTG